MIPLSTAFRNDERGYIDALTAYRYDGTDRASALSRYVEQFLAHLVSSTAAGQRLVEAATQVHAKWQAAVEGVRSDSALHPAIDLVVEHPVISARFLAERLGVSKVTAHGLIKKLEAVGIVAPATGKYRKSDLFQADDILNLIEFGAEAGQRASAVTVHSHRASTPAATLVHRCGAKADKGPCRNRVPSVGQQCWRHNKPAPT